MPIRVITMPILAIKAPTPAIAMRRSARSRCGDLRGHDGASRASDRRAPLTKAPMQADSSSAVHKDRQALAFARQRLVTRSPVNMGRAVSM
jgi:hypothetical protein